MLLDMGPGERPPGCVPLDVDGKPIPFDEDGNPVPIPGVEYDLTAYLCYVTMLMEAWDEGVSGDELDVMKDLAEGCPCGSYQPVRQADLDCWRWDGVEFASLSELIYARWHWRRYVNAQHLERSVELDDLTSESVNAVIDGIRQEPWWVPPLGSEEQEAANALVELFQEERYDSRDIAEASCRGGLEIVYRHPTGDVKEVVGSHLHAWPWVWPWKPPALQQIEQEAIREANRLMRQDQETRAEIDAVYAAARGLGQADEMDRLIRVGYSDPDATEAEREAARNECEVRYEVLLAVAKKTAPEGPGANQEQGAGMTAAPGPYGPPETAPGVEPGLQVMDLDAFLSMPEPEWLIRDFLDSGFSYLTGASNVGKTFVAIDLACHLAIGREWHGLKIPKAIRVLYLAAEDPTGVVTRLRAWMDTHADQGDRIALKERMSFSADTPSVIDPGDRNRLVATACQFDLTIVDTQTDITSGLNENSKQDMDSLLVVMKAIVDAGKSVLMIHHPNAGEGSWKPRGIGSQVGKANTVLYARPKDDDEKKNDGRVVVVAKKQKHARKGMARGFRIVQPGILEPLDYERPVPLVETPKWDPAELIVRAICQLGLADLSRDKLRKQSEAIADKLVLDMHSELLRNGKIVSRQREEAWGRIQRRKKDAEWEGDLWVSPDQAANTPIDLVFE
ncbi:AAA family ATPase [Actinoplanes sp. G11-F43]|uniref:AAA family ATPase n=1 Tax=Actinoplanes sp. G11-F43 TaxID=3424130 RepID=UPI003D3273F1